MKYLWLLHFSNICRHCHWSITQREETTERGEDSGAGAVHYRLDAHAAGYVLVNIPPENALHFGIFHNLSSMLMVSSGELKHKCTLPIHPVPGSSIDNLPPEHPRVSITLFPYSFTLNQSESQSVELIFQKPELDVQLSVAEPLLSEAQLKECNLMNITIESLYSPPETWSLAGQQYMYTATLPVPLNAEVSSHAWSIHSYLCV